LGINLLSECGRKRVHTEGPFLEASREALHQPIVEDVIEWEVMRNYHSYGIETIDDNLEVCSHLVLGTLVLSPLTPY